MRDTLTPALPVSDRDIERVLCGEAPPALVAHVDTLARAHPALAAHLAERRADQKAFALLHPRPPAPIAASSRLAHAPRWLSTVLPTSLAAACAIVFVVISAPETVRPKGAAAPLVDVVVKRGARVFRMQPGALLAAGDALRLEVECGRAAAVTVAVHERDTKKTTLLVDAERVPAARTLLSGSFVLDAHVGGEELWVTCAPDPALAARAATDMVGGHRPADAAAINLSKGP